MGKAERIREQKQERLVQTAAAAKKKGLNPKLKSILIGALSVVVIAALVAGIVVNTQRKNGTALKRADAIEVNGNTYKAAEVSFYYNTIVNQMSYQQQLYAAYGITAYNIDFSQSLFEQTRDSDTGLSWGDYILDQAVQQLYTYVTLEEAGKAAGFEMPETGKTELEETVAQLEESAAEQNVTAGMLLKANYGNAITTELYKEYLSREIYAKLYGQSVGEGFEVTQNDIDTYYGEHKTDFDVVDYRSFSFTVELPEHLDENGEKYSDDATKAEDEKLIAEALADLKKRVEAVKSEDEFNELAEEMTRGTDEDGKETEGVSAEETLKEGVGYSSLTTDMQTWMFDEAREAGDTNVASSSSTLTAYYFLNRDDRSELTRSVRHILLSSEEEDETIADKAQEILDKWLAGDKTEESFGALAAEYTEDTGSKETNGLYEKVMRGEMVSEFDEWLYDEARKPGDTEIIFSDDFGYHIMYYVGETDATTRDVLVDAAIREERYAAYLEQLEEQYPLTKLSAGLDKIEKAEK